MQDSHLVAISSLSEKLSYADQLSPTSTTGDWDFFRLSFRCMYFTKIAKFLF